MTGFYSMATTEIATKAVQHGVRLITHLFNAMPQLHHRDPSIIGLLGASPHLSSPVLNLITDPPYTFSESLPDLRLPASAVPAAEEQPTNRPKGPNRMDSRPTLHLDKGKVADMTFDRPYYGLIVDGIHCHPNSVRVRISSTAIQTV
jgi:N-acetylglucosamine-6-phosphate deacetylase